MQMYRVKFARHDGDVVDHGDVVVCASDLDHASDVVSAILDLPPSSTVFDVARVKPGLYQISRHEAPRPVGPSVATFPSADERHRYAVQASASVKAMSENGAIRKLVAAINAELAGQAPIGVGALQVLCERTDIAPKGPAIEQNAIYTNPTIFAGGDARGR